MVLSRSVISNPAPGELPSCRFQLQPQSNTPEPANQGVQGYLIITDRCAEVCRTVALQDRVGDHLSRPCATRSGVNEMGLLVLCLF